MRNLNYIYNGKRYVFSGTQYENPDKGTMRMQYTTQRTFTTTENATTTIQTATGTVTYPDTAITRYVYSTSSLMTTQKVTNMSSGTVRYGLTTDPEAAKYSPMPFVKENKTLYLGRSWTTYERATNPKEVDKIKTMVTTTYTTSKDFKHTSSSEYETDGKDTIPYDATVGSYYSQMQYITEYQTYDGFTTGGLFSTRNLTYTANNAYVTFNQTSSYKFLKRYKSFAGYVRAYYSVSSMSCTTFGYNVFPGWYFATSESKLNTVTLHYVAQTSSSPTTNYGNYKGTKGFEQYTTGTIGYRVDNDQITAYMTRLVSNYGTAFRTYYSTSSYSKSSSNAKNTRSLSTANRIDTLTRLLTVAYANNNYTSLTYMIRDHELETKTEKRTNFINFVDEITFWRSYYSITESKFNYTVPYLGEVGAWNSSAKTSTVNDSSDLGIKTADINELRNNYIPYYNVDVKYDDGEILYTSIKTISEPSIHITALINPQIYEQGAEGEKFIANQTVPYQEITSINSIYDDSDSRFTAWGISRRFIEKATSYNYTTSKSWETGGDKKTFTSILSGDPSEWITDEQIVTSPTVSSQRTMTKTSKFSGSDDWKYETTLASTVIKHVTRTKTYFPIITDAVTTMLSTQNYTTTEYPITATKTTHNFNV